MQTQSQAFSIPQTYVTDTKLFGNCVSHLSGFYDSAKKRDKAMVANMLAKMNAQNVDSGIIVAGGFMVKV